MKIEVFIYYLSFGILQKPEYRLSGKHFCKLAVQALQIHLMNSFSVNVSFVECCGGIASKDYSALVDRSC